MKTPNVIARRAKRVVATYIAMLCLIISPLAQAQVDTELSQVSLYEHPLQGKNQEAQKFDLASLQGKYVLLSFFYASCNYSCPLLLEALKKFDAQLNIHAKENSKIALISFDPKGDTPEKLKEKFLQNKLDALRWIFINLSENQLREITAILDVKYRRMQDQINHSTVFIVLDPQGKIIAREEGLANAANNTANLLNKLNP